jgi:ABC-2 type transport system permease protein
VEQTVGGAESDGASQALLDQLSEVRTGTNSLNTIEDDGDLTAEAAEAAALEERLASLETSLAEFTSLEPHIVVSPFRSETYSVASVQPDITSYYAPGVLALLLQHMAVTFGALSLVRERVTGSVELFRVSPISSAEVLTGKYAADMVFGGLLAAILTFLLRWLLDVPMVGNWYHLALAIGLLLLASLGIGFVISLLSHTASQAVQPSMLVLLASVFFSGFFVAPWLLWPEARALTWILPVTSGIQMLQTIMLRGEAPAFALIGGLLLIALLTFLWAWVLTRRLMAPR